MVAVTIPDFWAGVAAAIIVELLVALVFVTVVVLGARGSNSGE
jgi:hypothetical protein